MDPVVNPMNDLTNEPPNPPEAAVSFWSMGAGMGDPDRRPNGETTPALKLAGPLPLPAGGFPVMGFLATIYEQIAGQMKSHLDEKR